MKCVVANCTSEWGRDQNTLFFSFPKESQKRIVWTVILKYYSDHQINFDKDQICSKHFDESCFTIWRGRKTLQPNAVPTIFTNNKMVPYGVRNLQTYSAGSKKGAATDWVAGNPLESSDCTTCTTLINRINDLKTRYHRSQAFFKTMVCTEYHFEHSCGICAVNNERLAHLSIDNEEMLKSFISNLEINKSLLPCEMCLDCINKMELSHAYKYQCESAQISLMKHLIKGCERLNESNLQPSDRTLPADNLDVEMNDISFTQESNSSCGIGEVSNGRNLHNSNGFLNKDRPGRNGYIVSKDAQQSFDQPYNACVAEILDDTSQSSLQQSLKCDSVEKSEMANFKSSPHHKNNEIFIKFESFSEEEMQLGQYRFSVDDTIVGFRIICDTKQHKLQIESEGANEIKQVLTEYPRKDWSNVDVNFIPIILKNDSENREMESEMNSNDFDDESEEEEEQCIIEIKEEPLDLDSDGEYDRAYGGHYGSYALNSYY